MGKLYYVTALAAAYYGVLPILQPGRDRTGQGIAIYGIPAALATAYLYSRNI